MSEMVIDLRDQARLSGDSDTATDLGASWKAVRAWLRSSPLVLVQVEGGSGQLVKARLDLDKQVFIDPTPFASSGARVHLLAKLLGRLGNWDAGRRLR